MFLSITKIHLKFAHVGITLHLPLFIFFLTPLRLDQGLGTPPLTLSALYLHGQQELKAVKGQWSQNLSHIALKINGRESTTSGTLKYKCFSNAAGCKKNAGSFFAQQFGRVCTWSKRCNRSTQPKSFYSAPSATLSHAEPV